MTEFADSTREQMEQDAKPAIGSTGDKLRLLDKLAEARRKDPTKELRYTRLRDEMTLQLLSEGPRYYLDILGQKRYAYVVQPEPVEIDVDELIKMYQNGQISEETLNKSAPRKANAEGFKQEVSTGRISKQQFLSVAKMKKGTAHVAFTDPRDTATQAT